MGVENSECNVNANFMDRAVVRPKNYIWEASPVAGVERVKLDRIGCEVGRSTSIVRYAPDTSFPEHVHGGGEEIYVLEGIFADEYGSYPKGTYIRNPPGSRHTPMVGHEGATIFVKLHQFSSDDDKRVILPEVDKEWRNGVVLGLKVSPLHEHGKERTAVVRWDPYTDFSAHQQWGGEEIYVLEGMLYDEHGRYPAGSWIRNPHMSECAPFTRAEGALTYVKVGHLAEFSE